MVAFNILRDRLEREHEITMSCIWQADCPAGKVEHYMLIGRRAQIKEIIVIHSDSGYAAYLPQSTIKIDDDIAAIIGTEATD